MRNTDFKQLKIGMEVRYGEEMGEKGSTGQYVKSDLKLSLLLV